MKSYLVQHHVWVGLVGSLAALIVTMIYYFVVPEEALISRGPEKVILMYGHSVCWFLLSVASLSWVFEKTKKWSKFFAYGASGVYMIFLFTLLVDKFM